MKNDIVIKIQGHLDKNWEDWFDGLEIRYEGEFTILSGNMRDASSIYGIINRISDLNLKLISVNTIKTSNNNEKI